MSFLFVLYINILYKEETRYFGFNRINTAEKKPVGLDKLPAVTRVCNIFCNKSIYFYIYITYLTFLLTYACGRGIIHNVSITEGYAQSVRVTKIYNFIRRKHYEKLN